MIVFYVLRCFDKYHIYIKHKKINCKNIDKTCKTFLSRYKLGYLSFTARCKILFWHLYPDSLRIYENMSEAGVVRENKVNPAAINTIMPRRTCLACCTVCCAHHQSQSTPNINNSENAEITAETETGAMPLSDTCSDKLDINRQNQNNEHKRKTTASR